MRCARINRQTKIWHINCLFNDINPTWMRQIKTKRTTQSVKTDFCKNFKREISIRFFLCCITLTQHFLVFWWDIPTYFHSIIMATRPFLWLNAAMQWNMLKDIHVRIFIIVCQNFALIDYLYFIFQSWGPASCVILKKIINYFVKNLDYY